MSTINETIDYVKDVREGGLWYLFTGQKFPEWLADVAHNTAEFIYHNADYSLGLVGCFTLFAMAGSKKCVQYIYWSLITYTVVKAAGSALL